MTTAAGRLAAAAIGALLLGAPAAGAQEVGPREPAPEELGKAVREIERLDALRSGLARSFLGSGGDVDRETFRNVCQPVGKEERPAFVKEGYPEDRAYGFEVGDLRGIYSVFVPEEEPGEGSSP